MVMLKLKEDALYYFDKGLAGAQSTPNPDLQSDKGPPASS
jgi:hypothetical protein